MAGATVTGATDRCVFATWCEVRSTCYGLPAGPETGPPMSTPRTNPRRISCDQERGPRDRRQPWTRGGAAYTGRLGAASAQCAHLARPARRETPADARADKSVEPRRLPRTGTIAPAAGRIAISTKCQALPDDGIRCASTSRPPGVCASARHRRLLASADHASHPRALFLSSSGASACASRGAGMGCPCASAWTAH